MAAGTCRSRGWASVAVAVQWIGGSRSPGDLHRNATREGVSQGAGHQKRSQRRARDRADDASRLIPARARQDACKPETKGAPRRSKILQEKALAIENDIRGLLRNFGRKVGIVGVVGFEQRIHDLVEGVPEVADIMQPLPPARRVLREKFAKLHRKVLLLARDNEVCQRLMTIPGVGPVVSLAFISTVDVPARFRNSKAVGPSLGLTPVLNQSGESHRVGRISLCGDEAMRALLYEAAQVMLTRVQKWSWLKAWAMNIAKRRGQKKAIVALARRLAVIMHRMWSDGTEFRWTREMAPTI